MAVEHKGDYETVTISGMFAARAPYKGGGEATSQLTKSEDEAKALAVKMRKLSDVLDEVLLPKIHRIPDNAADVLRSTETVGDGCLCIYPFEKHYINLLLNDEIERVESDNKKLLEWEPLGEEEKKLSPEQVSRYKEMNKAAVEGVQRTYLRDLKTVLERFNKMPDCR